MYTIHSILCVYLHICIMYIFTTVYITYILYILYTIYIVYERTYICIFTEEILKIKIKYAVSTRITQRALVRIGC